MAYMTRKHYTRDEQPRNIHLTGLTDSDVESIQETLDESSDDDVSFTSDAFPWPQKQKK